MTTVGVRELKSHLAEWLRAVREGSTVVVTDRGRAIAEIRPIAVSDDTPAARRAAARTRGWIGSGEGVLAPARPLPYAGPSLASAVTQDRDERG